MAKKSRVLEHPSEDVQSFLIRARQVDPLCDEAAVRSYAREIAEAEAMLNSVDISLGPLDCPIFRFVGGRTKTMTSSGESLLDSSIREIGDGYRRRSWSPVDVIGATLTQIEMTEPSLHAWVLVDFEGALAAAAKAGQELETGIDRGPLHGIPIGIKDIFDVEGWPTRCGSASLDDAPPALANSPAVQALIDGGAIILGKTTTQEFAAGTISPPARNPWNSQRIPGGSSGGSAAAVAVGACFGAMGSDTGGSIRIPASACGVTGFKPAFGELDVSWRLPTVMVPRHHRTDSAHCE